MKHSFCRFLLYTLVVLPLIQCKKKPDEPELPAATTTGAMTFGCKVNGKVFVPRDGRGKPGLFVQYVYLGNGPGGGWYLNIPATNWRPNPPQGVNIGTDSLVLVEGRTYSIGTQRKGFASAFYANGPEFTTTDNNPGELHITRHDQQSRILSGTFFFTGTNLSTGEKVSVTDGRFDIRY